MQYPPSNRAASNVDLIRACGCVAADIIPPNYDGYGCLLCWSSIDLILHCAVLCLVIPMVIRQFIHLKIKGECCLHMHVNWSSCTPGKFLNCMTSFARCDCDCRVCWLNCHHRAIKVKSSCRRSDFHFLLFDIRHAAAEATRRIMAIVVWDFSCAKQKDSHLSQTNTALRGIPLPLFDCCTAQNLTSHRIATCFRDAPSSCSLSFQSFCHSLAPVKTRMTMSADVSHFNLRIHHRSTLL